MSRIAAQRLRQTKPPQIVQVVHCSTHAVTITEALKMTLHSRFLLLLTTLSGTVASGCGDSEADAGRGPATLPGGDQPGSVLRPPVQPGQPSLVTDDPVAPTNPTGSDCESLLQVTYRDFDESHPDFEPEFRGDGLRLGLVEPVLGADQKPIYKSSLGCPPSHADRTVCDNSTREQAVIKDSASFDQWYRTTPGVNHEKLGEILLTPSSGASSFVFESTQFFPLEPSFGFGVTPAGHWMGENFLFTTEIHLSFAYVRGQRFEFFGDDDLWIFVNNRLALDQGSMHGPEKGVIDFDLQAAALGIVPGSTYAMDIFHAERHTDGSHFRIETNISCFKPVKVRIAK